MSLLRVTNVTKKHQTIVISFEQHQNFLGPLIFIMLFLTNVTVRVTNVKKKQTIVRYFI